ncbi:hypothetical protein GCM10007907_31260 [Chitinimonas prasina]|uniref:Transposase n=2 Tax=Chitinimonas prasina TaxID=1434937 RepID=A0ABQ5YIC6_9NEIS|nr:hypothetical protein GCM10007907_31260 [Chitinimonas prasina]
MKGKAQAAQRYGYRQRLATLPFAGKDANPAGLIWKTAIHCVVALGNNLSLPAHHAVCLAIFQISDTTKRH